MTTFCLTDAPEKAPDDSVQVDTVEEAVALGMGEGDTLLCLDTTLLGAGIHQAPRMPYPIVAVSNA